ncbi:MAG: hypothetical protein CMN77_08390 [Spirochaetaceae bacterium]|nr:hypothetical protein [Spirochaetaceae bacterium]|tara:strand:+ start:27058 stop:29508 length:2451 start_codon:yes stop_codon:yes gene_type:complete
MEELKTNLSNSNGISIRPEETLNMVSPSWPLQSIAAVNPFWFFRDRTFYQVVTELSPILHASLLMPLQYYLEEFARGNITDSSIESVLEEYRSEWEEIPRNVDDLIQLSRGTDAMIRRYPSVAEQIQANQYWHRCVQQDLGKMVAAYLDDQQALAPFPGQNGDFWNAFTEAIQFDRSMEAYGATGFRQYVRELTDLTAGEAIERALKQMGLASAEAQKMYLQRLLASILGWASQFKYMEWQTSLGYDVARRSSVLDLLAVRVLYDYGLFRFSQDTDFAPALSFWQTSYNELGSKSDRMVHGYRLHYVWQCAQERSFQKRVASGFVDAAPGQEPPRYQMAFCIDVRSEVIRRRLEAEEPALRTIGFAGFFGLPFAYKQISEKHPASRLPVLLKPAFVATEEPRKNARVGRKSLNTGMILSYFRNLRKAPLSSFLFVELFGLLSVEKVVRQTFHSLMRKFRGNNLPQRFDDRRTIPDHKNLMGSDGQALSVSQKADLVKGPLRHMGLLDRMAEFVFLVGHGADTTNNAFGSSLDCGACGGHAGDINARLLASLLNEPEVRSELAGQGIRIPDATLFIPAIHETVTDNIYILDLHRVPEDRKREVKEVQKTMDLASRKARKERSVARSAVLDPHFNRRPRNWAEIRPEWGLTGNASFIVAPRERTRGMNLHGRSFLHDYDWSRDDGFQSLELIMTAPMVVTNWINMQYYASSVAPDVYGSGSKLLHNLVCETRVQSGNGGDLRVGLPFQSVHDGERLVHEPLRLSVFIEAPEDAIESIIQKHEVVRDLVDNDWLLLLQIHPEDKVVRRRQKGGKYAPMG